MQDNHVQFEALFTHATIGIVVTDQEGRIINFNKYAEEQFGYSKEEVLGKKVEILLPPQFRAAHVNYRQGFYEHPAHRRMGEGRDLNAQKKDKTVFPVEVSISSYNVEGEIYVIAFIIDITVRKSNEETVLKQKDELEKISRQVTQLNMELERKVDDRTRMLKETLAELEKSKEELSEALEVEKQLSDLKSRFVSMASHEFRTPLSTILSSAYLIEQYIESGTTEKAPKHLKRIKGAVAGLKGILEDFLSLDKLEKGGVQANPEILTAEECITEIRDVMQELEQLLKPGQTMEFEHQGEHAVEVDRHLLRNILINLISNAVKFSAETGEIKISVSCNENELAVSVKDTGIGISHEDQQFLAERFFRAKNAVNIQGTGLGLHIVVKYLELMNGHIEMKSELGAGSEFIIHIPTYKGTE